jgi:multiple sugar transport system ATP-binding protein
MAGVSFRQVRKVFGPSVAVQSLDLDIAEGEFVSLLGPSGCGKTTTLRMLAGLESLTSGEISIGGRVVNEVAPGARDIAMVFQSYALYPHMTVAENIAYPLKKRGMAKPEREQRVRKAAETLKLTELLARKPRQLSGGQQQRVALGRALVRDPKVFLLDEPLSNLDAKLRAHMRAELIELHQRLGRTFIYVTHDQLEAMTMSNRIAVMHEGVLQQIGSPKDVYDHPANLFVAGFIGAPSMNMFRGKLDGGRFRHAALDLAVSGATGEMIIGVRPEDVTLGHGPHRATVRVLEPAGHETLIIMDASGDQLTARARPDTDVAPGQMIPFDVRNDRLHCFDAGSGQRLAATFPSASKS